MFKGAFLKKAPKNRKNNDLTKGEGGFTSEAGNILAREILPTGACYTFQVASPWNALATH